MRTNARKKFQATKPRARRDAAASSNQHGTPSTRDGAQHPAPTAPRESPPASGAEKADSVPAWVYDHHARVVEDLTTSGDSLENGHRAATEASTPAPNAGGDSPDVEVEDITEEEAMRGGEASAGDASLPDPPPRSPSPLRWVDSQAEPAASHVNR